jgi:hypothetical protein
VRQAERQGILPVLAVSLRELGDFPVNLISEYWEEYHMHTLQLSQPVIRPVWWGAVWFGCSAVLANLISTTMLFPPSAFFSAIAPHWFPWGEWILYAILGGLGGFFFALACQQSRKAKLFLVAGFGGFLIGHLLGSLVMIGLGILNFYLVQNADVNGTMNILIRLIDLVFIVSLTGLFIGWMNKDRRQAGLLAWNGALGVGIGGLIGLGFCWILNQTGAASVGQIVIITSMVFAVNCIGGILGGALLGRAIGQRGAIRDLPASS